MTNMETEPQRELTDEHVARLDAITASEPQTLAAILAAACNGDQTAIEYLARSSMKLHGYSQVPGAPDETETHILFLDGTEITGGFKLDQQ